MTTPAPDTDHKPLSTDLAAEVRRLFNRQLRSDLHADLARYGQQAGIRERLVVDNPTDEDLANFLVFLLLEWRRQSAAYAGMLEEDAKLLTVLQGAVSKDAVDPEKCLGSLDYADLAADEIRNLRSEKARDAEALWQLLDDIDTADDRIKPLDTSGGRDPLDALAHFREVVMAKVAQRHEVLGAIKPCTGDVLPTEQGAVETRFVELFYLDNGRTGLRFEDMSDIYVPDADAHRLALAVNTGGESQTLSPTNKSAD